MASASDDDGHAVLSDIEAEEPVPIVLNSPAPDDFPHDRFHQHVADLHREHQARQATENNFSLLKALAHEAIKMRDDVGRERDNAWCENERLSAELAESLRVKDKLLKQRDDVARRLEESESRNESLRSEIEYGTQILVAGIQKIGSKVSDFQNFSIAGLSGSQKYSGMPAVGYGIIKRTNEIVEELLKQLDAAKKSRDKAREQVEQRNYEIAIEVSQLEDTISRLKEQLCKKSLAAEDLAKEVAEKSTRISDMDREILDLRRRGEECVHKMRSLELKMDSQKPLVIDQLSYMSKAREQLYKIMKMVGVNASEQMDSTNAAFLSNGSDEHLHASLDGMKSIHELLEVAAEKLRDEMEEKTCEVRGLRETVNCLVTEKRRIGSLIGSTLSKKRASDPSSKTRNVSEVEENGLREPVLDVSFSDALWNGKTLATHDSKVAMEIQDDENYTLAGALEKIVVASQLETIKLQHSVEALRAESSRLETHLEVQAKELSQRKQQIQELEEKERVANESVEGLMMDIAAAEEEIARWKLAAEQEAAAGRAVEQDFFAQLLALKHELEEAKQAVVESENKLKFKEETAAAAMAARDAAEKSLKLADLRSLRLRERLEELTHQLEELDTKKDLQEQNRRRYKCWPWLWMGFNFVGFQAESRKISNEMELSEPLL